MFFFDFHKVLMTRGPVQNQLSPFFCCRHPTKMLFFLTSLTPTQSPWNTSLTFCADLFPHTGRSNPCFWCFQALYCVLPLCSPPVLPGLPAVSTTSQMCPPAESTCSWFPGSRRSSSVSLDSPQPQSAPVWRCRAAEKGEPPPRQG